MLDTVAQALPPHYSPFRDAESDLAVGPYGYLMTINFLNRGLLSFAFLLAFVRTIRTYGGNTRQYRAGINLLCVWAAGAILLAIFPTDVPAVPMSAHGAVHFVVAIVAFIGGAFGTLVLSLRFGQGTVFKRAKNFAVVLSLLAIFFFAIEFFTPFVAPGISAGYDGLFERLFLGAVLLWILAVSITAILHLPFARVV